MGNLPRVMELRFLGAAYKILMELEPPPEHVREQRKQAKRRVERVLLAQLPAGTTHWK